MPVTVNVNGLSLCHQLSGGVSMATLPDVCVTSGAGPVPYPNVAFSRDLAKGTTTVSADGADMCANFGSEFSRSTGDEPGTGGGVASHVNTREATWLTYSFDVKLEGKGACRLTDKMFHNHQNTVNMGGLIQKYLLQAGGDKKKACELMLQKIVDLIGEGRTGKVNGVKGLDERIREQVDGGGLGKMGAPNAPAPADSKTGKNAWQTHDDEIVNQRRSLDRHLTEYRDDCGNDPPPPSSAREWVTKPRPTPAEYKGPLYSTNAGDGWRTAKKVGMFALVGLAAVGTVAAFFNPFDGGPVGGVAAAEGTELLWAAAAAM